MSDYEVGYGKPPKEHRFRKGESGNPKGRRKGARNFRTDVQETLNTPVPITEGGARRTVSTQKAMLLRLREKALKGDARALDRYLELAGRYNDEDRPPTGMEGPVADSDRVIIERALARRSGTAMAAEAAGPSAEVEPASTATRLARRNQPPATSPTAARKHHSAAEGKADGR